MKKFLIRLTLLVAIMAAMVLGYYYLMQREAAKRAEWIIEDPRNLMLVDDDSGKVSLQGKLIRVENRYYLEVNTKARLEITSKQLSLSSFVDKQVEISGVLSGERIAVEKIQEL